MHTHTHTHTNTHTHTHTHTPPDTPTHTHTHTPPPAPPPPHTHQQRIGQKKKSGMGGRGPEERGGRGRGAERKGERRNAYRGIICPGKMTEDVGDQTFAKGGSVAWRGPVRSLSL